MCIAEKETKSRSQKESKVTEESEERNGKNESSSITRIRNV